MLNISIDSETAVVENPTTYSKWTVKTPEIFGTIYASLEKHFPKFETKDYGAMIVAHVIKEMRGQDDVPMWLFHVPEIGTTLYDLKGFIDDRDIIILTLKDIEKMRIQHGMTANFLPVSLGDEDSMRFENLKSATQVSIAILYFYAFNDYRLVRCKHCGKWFATKNLKEKYCTRNSSFAGYESYSCKNAVKTIKDMLEKKRISEYERLRLKAVEYGANSRHNQIFNDFCVSCGDYKAALKKGASVKLLQDYKAFLFDSANVRPKYERIKNW